MENEKRTLFAFVLIAAFLYVWFEFFVPKPKPVEPSKEEGKTTQEQVQEQGSPQAEPRETQAGLRSVPTPKPKIPEPKAVQIPFSTKLLRGEWTNQGGTLETLVLREFKKTREGEEKVHVIPFKPGDEKAFLWKFEVDGQTFDDNGSVYEVKEKGGNSIVFERSFSGMLRVEKEFRWSGESYEMEHAVRVTNLTGRPIEVNASMSMATAKGEQKGGGFLTGRMQTPLGAVAYINDSSTRLTPEEVVEGEEFPEGPIEWAALDSHYFLVASIPVEGLWKNVNAEAGIIEEPGEDPEANAITLWMHYAPKALGPSTVGAWKLKTYGGPKDIGILNATQESLDRVIDLGAWLGPIARAILHFLRFLHGVVGNFGVAIVLLTILVRLLMFPLAQMQAKSMKKMQQHKPQMDALKEKHKDDKEAYSRELMTYMRSHKINPMGGCLLLLPQLPIFFALYRVLYNSIELRHAPFMFWIQDLSAKDPYFVMPVLLGIAMFFQTRLTPSPGSDPMQQNMMKMMPVMFTFFMLFLPAGLNLYILISTLWGIGQQLWVQRDMKMVTAPQKKTGSK